MIYIMSDIHGCYDAFLKMLELINFKDEDFLYILGDVIDRGEEPLKVLDYCMTHDNIELLLGNHEHMCRKYYENIEYNYSDWIIKDSEKLWFDNGGKITYEKLNQLSRKNFKKYFDYLSTLKIFKVLKSNTTEYLLVHAGIYPYKDMDLKETLRNQTLDDLIWSRTDFINNRLPLSFKVIFGHTPTIKVKKRLNEYNELSTILKQKKIEYNKNYKDNEIIYFNNKIGIDGGYVFGRNLNCISLNLETDEIKEYSIKY